jgi:hypothetical protein
MFGKYKCPTAVHLSTLILSKICNFTYTEYRSYKITREGKVKELLK